MKGEKFKSATKRIQKKIGSKEESEGADLLVFLPFLSFPVPAGYSLAIT